MKIHDIFLNVSIVCYNFAKSELKTSLVHEEKKDKLYKGKLNQLV
jgi:hypothetical protein